MISSFWLHKANVFNDAHLVQSFAVSFAYSSKRRDTISDNRFFLLLARHGRIISSLTIAENVSDLIPGIRRVRESSWLCIGKGKDAPSGL